MRSRFPAIIVVLAALCVAARAAPLEGSEAAGDPIADQLFPPELVMKHRTAIGLTDAQRRAITSAIAALQSKVTELQWDLQDAQESLVASLSRSPVDETEALARADRVMQLERSVKREHLATLIRIKNRLTPPQQAKLRALSAARDDRR